MAPTVAERRWTLPSRLGEERNLMRSVERFILRHSPHEPRIDDIKTALAEAFLNAAEHGNGLGRAKVRIAVGISAEAFELQVCDQGGGFELSREPAVAELWEKADPRGWGLYLIGRLADDLRVERRSSDVCLHIIFRRNKEERHAGEQA